MKIVFVKKQYSNFRNAFFGFALIISVLSVFSVVSFTQEKGKDADWESAGKQGIGTALSEKSKVWFTLQGGSLTEVFYPTADKANVQVLQFIVFNKETGKVETERDDAIHKIVPLLPENNPRAKNYHPQSSFALEFTQINTAKSGKWEISKTYITDPNSDVVLIDVKFKPKESDLVLYVYYDPSLNNSGMSDNGWTEDGILMANEGNIFSALAFSYGRNSPNQFEMTSNGFLGKDDGLTELRKNKKINIESKKTENGNVVQVAEIPPDVEEWKSIQRMGGGGPNSDLSFTLALAFGDSAKNTIKKARQSLFKGFEITQFDYEQGWNAYLRTLPKIEPKYQAQFNYAAMVLRASEDKTYRGGNVASLSKPWIPSGDANSQYVSGYHLVWSRDLYQVASAYIAMGDKDSANRALDYLFNKQQKADGSYPQMTWLDGRVVGDSLQMDEVAYPLILAYQLGRNDRETYEKHIKPTADFIIKTGPTTKQERWEEKPGYSPATIAAEIAGLVCAADIAQKNGDESSAKLWLEKADDWAKNVEKWTVTTKGKYGDCNYYLRLSKNGTPDAGDKIELNNGAGTWLESEIVDSGFLELVRLGIKSPNDPLIVKSLKVVDEVLKVETPNGAGFYRYNHDGYGEYEDGRNWNYDRTWTGKGHLWALLTGERGQYEIAKANNYDPKIENLSRQADGQKNTDKEFKLRVDSASNQLFKRKLLNDALKRLETMQKFANDGMMIPEQVWSQNNGVFPFGEGSGSATPLTWSMAQFIRLAVNLKAGKNLDTPEVVARRYGNLK